MLLADTLWPLTKIIKEVIGVILDKQGKLFGKISIIDIGLILIILAAGVFVGLKFVAPQNTEVKHLEINYVVKVSNIKETSAKYIKPGEVLVDGDGVAMGTIMEGVKTEPTLGLQFSQEGEAFTLPVPERTDVYVPIKADAIKNENGIFLDGKVSLLIGTERFFRASDIDFIGTVIEIK